MLKTGDIGLSTNLIVVFIGNKKNIIMTFYINDCNVVLAFESCMMNGIDCSKVTYRTFSVVCPSVPSVSKSSGYHFI